MDLSAVAMKIIKEQQSVIGPLAIDQARKVSGLSVEGSVIKIVGNQKNVLTELVKQYAELFGQASVEVCKDAVREVNPPIPADELPDILK